MSKSLSVASVIEKNRLSSDVPFLILLDIDVINPESGAFVETLRIVRNTEPVDFGGNAYQPASFDIELKEEAGAQQNVTLSIKDYTNTIQRRMQDYGGGVGFAVGVMVVNGAALDLPPEITEYFEVVSADSSAYVCNFGLGAENNLVKTFPRRRQARDYCQWRFRSDECGYTGPLLACDLSLKGANGCKVHDNVIHFGGFPGINTRDISYG